MTLNAEFEKALITWMKGITKRFIKKYNLLDFLNLKEKDFNELFD